MTLWWLTIIFFLWILRSGTAIQCRTDDEKCYIDHSREGICRKDCYNLTEISLINVPEYVLRKESLPAELITILDLDIVGNISSILDTMEPPLNTLRSINITGSDLEILSVTSTIANKLTILDTKINKLIFQPQNYIKKIRISRNLLTEFNIEHLRSLPKADILDLSFNKISVFGKLFEIKENGADIVLNPSMRYLNLSNNQMVNLHNKTFQTMPHLKILDLSHNNIGDLNSAPFCNMKTTLIELYLSNNSISSLAVDLFHNLYSLNVLYLDYNYISHLENDIFTNLPHLIILDLSFNQLHSIHSVSILRLTKLTQLNLESNNIEKFDFQIASRHHPSIKNVNLRDNPLFCYILQEQYIPQSVILSSQGYCSGNGSYLGFCCSDITPVENATIQIREEETIDQFREITEVLLDIDYMSEQSAILYGIFVSTYILGSIGLFVVFKYNKRRRLRQRQQRQRQRRRQRQAPGQNVGMQIVPAH